MPRSADRAPSVFASSRCEISTDTQKTWRTNNMSYLLYQRVQRIARVPVLVAALALGCALSTATYAERQQLLRRSRHQRETLYSSSAMRSALKGMFVCPRAPAHPGPSAAVVPKPPSSSSSSGRRCKSSLTSSAPIQTRTSSHQTRCPSAARRGKAFSIVVQCGPRR